MKTIKIFLFIVVATLLLTGLYSKMFNTDFQYVSATVGGKFTEVVLTGNCILILAFIFIIPLVLILKRRKPVKNNKPIA